MTNRRIAPDDTYNSLVAQAKKMRAAARRAEAKGDMALASRIRGEDEGINHELLYLRQNWNA